MGAAWMRDESTPQINDVDSAVGRAADMSSPEQNSTGAGDHDDPNVGIAAGLTDPSDQPLDHRPPQR
jgi:hypothetical protein